VKIVLWNWYIVGCRIQVVYRPFWYCGWAEMRMRGDQVFFLLSVVQ